MYILAPKYINT